MGSRVRSSRAREKEGKKRGSLDFFAHDLWVRVAREETKEEEKATKGAGRLVAVSRTRQDQAVI